MRFANHDGRLTLIEAASAQAPDVLDGVPGIDVHRASDERIPADPAQALEVWPQVRAWAHDQGHADVPDGARFTLERERIGSPSPRPAQIFGIGVNYADHGAEAKWRSPRCRSCSPSCRPR